MSEHNPFSVDKGTSSPLIGRETSKKILNIGWLCLGASMFLYMSGIVSVLGPIIAILLNIASVSISIVVVLKGDKKNGWTLCLINLCILVFIPGLLIGLPLYLNSTFS